MSARLEANRPAPKWDDYLTSVDVLQMNGRVLRCYRLTTNLTKMMRVVEKFLHDGTYGPVANENLILARRLTWIMFYFYGAMFRFASWISARSSPKSAVNQNEQIWFDFMRSLQQLLDLLIILPNKWTAEGIENIVDNSKQDQLIPAEAPLELVVQIFLNLHDQIDHLNNPGKYTAPYLLYPPLLTKTLPFDAVQNALRRMAERNQFPGHNTPSSCFTDHDGFSNCIFVTQSDVPSRALLAGSTVLYLGYFHNKALTQKFKDLRLLRFRQGPDQYDTELRLRFRNPDDENYPYTTPDRRYQDCDWNRNSSGPTLAEHANNVSLALTEEYAGIKPEYPRETNLVPPDQRKSWVPFSYENQRARSHFAMKAHANQQALFESVPRCMKCRVIHNYDIAGEDMEVQAAANSSCQCAEDIAYGKLRILERVGNVFLHNVIIH